MEVTFSDPPFLQKKEEYGDKIQLTGYTVKCQPHGDQEDNAEFIDFPYDMPSNPTPNASPTQQRRMKLAGLMPGKKYKVVVAPHYSTSTGRSIHSDEREFTTKCSGMYLTVHVRFKQTCMLHHINYSTIYIAY